jgi:hypothetical protein
MADERETVAILALLLDASTQDPACSGRTPERTWQCGGHPHLDSPAWHPQGPGAYGRSGRLRAMLSRRTGKR